MKILLPILIILLVIAGAIFYFKFGKGSSGNTNQTAPATVAEKAIPITGNPDDISAAVDKAAVDEGLQISQEDDGATISEDAKEAGDLGGAINESDF